MIDNLPVLRFCQKPAFNFLRNNIVCRFSYSSTDKLGQLRTGSPYAGKVATYGAGGFLRELRPATYKTAHYNIDELYQNDWIDNQTRAVFLELTVYNPNLHIFCAVKCVFAGDCNPDIDLGPSLPGSGTRKFVIPVSWA